jgi:hypothetical protein
MGDIRLSGGSVRHWIRPLKDGGVEFFMRAPGQFMSGSATGFSYRTLCAVFEQSTGVTLPEPEIKPMRGGHRV